MTAPTAEQVAAFAGRGDDTEFVAAARAALPIVTAMINGYTRGVGFTPEGPDEALAAVVVSSTARLAANPDHVVSESLGDYSIRPGVFAGWTLPELAILNGYRVTAL